ncbi:MAG: DUF11 domain-containing protein [Planctomycetes bacterium]|nr:DUF11 domain-containing protein [Planctomycetota bacterium]
MTFSANKSLIATTMVAFGLLFGCSEQQTVTKPNKTSTAAAKSGANAGASTASTSETATSSNTSTSAPAATETAKPAPAASSSTSMSTMSGGATATRAFPTGDRATSAILLEKSAPDEVMVGESFDVRMNVTNLTQNRLDGVVVSDMLDGNFALASSTPSAGSGTGGRVVWNLGSLNAGETKTIVMNGKANGAGSITNCAEVQWQNMVCVTTNVVAPNLQITKKGPAEVMACDEIVYTFTVTNNGTGTARNVRVEDNLPAGLVASDGSSKLSFNVGSLAGGESKEMSANVKATKTGSFQNSATAMADGGLKGDSNSVTTVVRKPALALEMNCPSQAFTGTSARFRITVRNTGDGACDDTVVSATIPTGTTFMSADNGGKNAGQSVQWMLGRLEPNGSTELSFTVRPEQIGAIKSAAEVVCRCSEPARGECSVEVKGIPAVLLEVIDIEDPIQVGSSNTYEIVVTNQGSALETNIRIVCELEDEMEYVSSQDPRNGPGKAAGKTITFEPLPSLAAKAKATYRVVVKAVKSGDVRFKVTMLSGDRSRTVEETEATNFYE